MTDTMMTTRTRKTKAKASKLFSDELIDQLLAQVQNKDAGSILGESGLAGQLKKQLAERMLAAELNHHLATEVAQQPAAGNHRNGTSPKMVITPGGELQLDIPRERARDSGTFAGTVWPANITRSDLHHYRRSAGRGRAMADAPARSPISDCLLRCAAAEDPGQRHGQEQGCVPGAGHPRRRAQGSAGIVDRADRRRQDLAQGLQRAEKPRAGRPYQYLELISLMFNPTFTHRISDTTRLYRLTWQYQASRICSETSICDLGSYCTV